MSLRPRVGAAHERKMLEDVPRKDVLMQERNACMTFYLFLDYGGDGQDDEETKTRHGTAYGTEAIRRVLETVGVSRWEKLPGTPVRARAEHNKIHAIGHYLKDQWLDLGELGKEYREPSSVFPTARSVAER